MRRLGGKWRRTASVLAGGALLGVLLAAPPASAHFQASISHLATHMKQLFYTKSESDARYSNAVDFVVKLGPGQQKQIAQHGPLTLTAMCQTVGGNDRLRIVAATTQDGSILRATDNYTGSTFLNASTPVDNRRFFEHQAIANTTVVTAHIDRGYVLAPNGKMLSIDGETAALGLNYGGAKCIAAGVVHKLG